MRWLLLALALNGCGMLNVPLPGELVFISDEGPECNCLEGHACLIKDGVGYCGFPCYQETVFWNMMASDCLDGVDCCERFEDRFCTYDAWRGYFVFKGVCIR